MKYEPAAQGEHDVEPAVDTVPAGHGKQAVLPALEYVFAGHTVHAIFASSDTEPSTHASHVSLLLANVPAKQRVQAAPPVDAQPNEHAVHWPPAVDELPSAQATHEVWSADGWVPTAHLVHTAAAAAAEAKPLGQPQHVRPPLPLWYVPAAQSVHGERPDAEYVPGAQAASSR